MACGPSSKFQNNKGPGTLRAWLSKTELLFGVCSGKVDFFPHFLQVWVEADNIYCWVRLCKYMKLDLYECEHGYEKITRGEAGPSSAEIRGTFPNDSNRG